MQGGGSDQPIFAESQVSYVGQSIALVIAQSEQEAIRLAQYVTENCIGYTTVTWSVGWKKPILSLKEAIAKNSIFPDYPKSAPYVSHIWKVIRPGSHFNWASEKDPLTTEKPLIRDKKVDSNPCLIVESSQLTGGQIHFYMETQACVAYPTDDESCGNTLI